MLAGWACGLMYPVTKGGNRMEVRINQGVLALVQGDITGEETDAIVNAANSRLRGGAGVDGAIHRAGGPSIMDECRKIGGCPTGQAVITTGGNLKAKYVIHTVGPVYQGGTSGEADLLRSAYLSSLRLAAAKGLKSIALPAISTGVYRYPLAEAAHIALKTAVDYLRENTDIDLVRFVLYDRRTYDVFVAELGKLI
jgi:O-acetyl-ADP-ribose deacetylase (regulator of RNase III)